jgi:hypothetical protein
LPEYFVWSTPALIRLIDAADPQAAAEMFSDTPVSPIKQARMAVAFSVGSLGEVGPRGRLAP